MARAAQYRATHNIDNGYTDATAPPSLPISRDAQRRLCITSPSRGRQVRELTNEIVLGHIFPNCSIIQHPALFKLGYFRLGRKRKGRGERGVRKVT